MGWYENKSLTKEIAIFKNRCFLLENRENVAKVVVDNALGGKTVAAECQLLSN